MKTTGTLEDFEAALRLGQPGGGPGVEPAYSPYGCGKNRVTEIYLNLPQVLWLDRHVPGLVSLGTPIIDLTLSGLLRRCTDTRGDIHED